MQINKHGSFYLRNGWPTKIIDVIIQNRYVFSPANEREPRPSRRCSLSSKVLLQEVDWEFLKAFLCIDG